MEDLRACVRRYICMYMRDATEASERASANGSIRLGLIE